MDLTVHQHIGTFLAETEEILSQDEVTNGLILSIALRLKRDPARFEHAPYLATIRDGGKLAAAGLMTPPHGLVVYARPGDPSPAMRLLAADLVASAWPLPTVNGVVDVSRAFAGAWQAITGGEVTVGIAMRVFELRAVTPPAGVSGSLRCATPADLDRVFAWANAFRDEAIPSDSPPRRELLARSIAEENIYLWEDGGRVVSIAAKGRRTAHGLSVGLVYTPPELRGRGYASACVAALSQVILDEGADFCTLFTDLANPTSNSIYQKIGYRPVCDFTQFALSRPA